MPSDVSGATFEPAPPSTLYQSKFKVKCKSLYKQQGSTEHTESNNTVECGKDGHWIFGTIVCEGMLMTFVRNMSDSYLPIKPGIESTYEIVFGVTFIYTSGR